MQYNPREHKRYVEMLGERLKDIEHFRVRAENRHIAVAVLTNGECFVGEARCSVKDVYSRKLGFTIAVGRALKKTQIENQWYDFEIDPALSGRELREVILRRLAAVETNGPGYLAHTLQDAGSA